jgi:hypothetical protein
VSLCKEDAIRFEWYKPGIHNRFKIYIFKCSCGEEIRSRTSHFKVHTGFCRKCTAQRTVKIAGAACRLRPYEAKFNIFKSKCPETNLTYEDYLKFVGENCHYCEKILPWQPFGENNPGFWLDRKNSTLGHTNGNLVTCCGNCNFTKTNRFTYDEFMLLAPVLKQIRLAREAAKK